MQTDLGCLDTNTPAEGVPQVDEIGDDDAFTFLRFDFVRQQGFANATFDTRDLRFD